MVEPLETSDIQGLVVRGFGELPVAAFYLLTVSPDRAPAARAFLRALEVVTAADPAPTQHATQVAFTHPGLVALGVPAGALDTFSREFKEGLADPVRACSIGDQGVNDPSQWGWGRPDRIPHVMLLVYADTEARLAAWDTAHREAFTAAFAILEEKRSKLLPHDKEHFGWKDGISTPIIEGLKAVPRPSWTNPFPAGEFVLGYENEYGDYTERPTAPAADVPGALLPILADAGLRDLGRNGTYLVHREMTQDVRGLWTYLRDASREPGADVAARAIALGAKLVGRWPDGAPLTLAPTAPAAGAPAHADTNEFTYWERDRHGLGCPHGAHIRRANPRDDLPTDHGETTSIAMVRKHQMLRRGRPFGAPLAASMEPRDFLACIAAGPEPVDAEARGLHFLCLVGHIGRQFEFVQRAWFNSPNFAALFRDADPLIGVHRDEPDANVSNEFSVPAEPLRRRYTGMTQFTRVVGGGYFFLPGLRALRFFTREP